MNRRNRVTGAAVCVGVLAAGVAGMLGLASLRKPPAEAGVNPGAAAIRVETILAEPVDVTVTLTGFGEVASVRTVDLAAEVSGTVVETHERLVTGGIVREGEQLFAIDSRLYEAAVAQCEAQMAELDAQSKRLTADRENDLLRLETLKRNLDLAQSRFDRANKLFEQAIGDKTEVEAAQRFVHDAQDAIRLLDRQLNVYPLRVEEVRQQRAALEATANQARLNLSYCSVAAPFNARIVDVMVERGQYVTQGRTVLQLADDSALEIPVQLDAQEAREWLRFAEAPPAHDTAWFAGLDPVTCDIRWAEDGGDKCWKGTLDRVERFDATTRTISVVVRVTSGEARGTDGALPLVDGMFCEVQIPGKTLHDVYRLPQGAVTVDQTVHLAVDDTLHSALVQVVRREGAWALIRGIEQGDQLITTRLVSVIDGMPLEVTSARPAAE
jgi:multidrug efflux pump subunit AcrA (membrane-fusion protein)